MVFCFWFFLPPKAAGFFFLNSPLERGGRRPGCVPFPAPSLRPSPLVPRVLPGNAYPRGSASYNQEAEPPDMGSQGDPGNQRKTGRQEAEYSKPRTVDARSQGGPGEREAEPRALGTREFFLRDLVALWRKSLPSRRIIHALLYGKKNGPNPI